MHPSWRRQNGRIWANAAHDPDRDGWVARWLAAAGDGAALSTARSLLRELIGLPPLPSGSTTRLARFRRPRPCRSARLRHRAEHDPGEGSRVVGQGRVDEAAVRASSGERSASRVSATRIGIDEPYIASKQSLLHVVCEANDVRCVFSRGVDLATVVGPVGQLADVELLFSSLLIQVQAALAADAAAAPAGSHSRSRRYRSSFIVGFAARIRKRLHVARSASFASAGTDALPVLAADDQATAGLFDRAIGRTTLMRSSAKYDSLGVQAGSHAADRASLRDAGLGGSPARPVDELPEAG